MKKYSYFLSLFLLLSSCTNNKKIENNDYINNLNIFDFQEDVKILQLTDLHWNFGTDFKREKNYLDSLIDKADPDIIMITGDSVLAGRKNCFTNLFEYLNSKTNKRNNHIYWNITWGNHDKQGTYSPSTPSNLAKKYSSTEKNISYKNSNGKYGLYIDVEDNIFGKGNSITNLTYEGKTIFQLWNVDSGSDYYNKTHYQYDAIHDDQIELFSKLAKHTRTSNELIPSFAFIHVPLFESSIAYDEAHDKKTIPSDSFGGELREKVNPTSPLVDEVIEDATRMYIGYKNTHFFSMAKDNGVKGIFYGHDHVNDFWSIYEGVLLAYGTKSSDQLYYLDNLIGGNLLTIHKNGNLDLRRNDKVSNITTDFKQVLVNYQE